MRSRIIFSIFKSGPSNVTSISYYVRLSLLLVAVAIAIFLSGADGQTAEKKQPLPGLTPLAGPEAPQGRPKYAPGELLVKFRDEASDNTIAALHKQFGVRSLRAFSGIKVHHLKLPRGLSVEDALAKYRSHPAVVYAEPNYLFRLQVVPKDSAFGNLWGLDNTGQSVNGLAGTVDADIDAPEAWDVTTGSSNVVIAVIDSGIAYDHPDLAPNIWTNPGETLGDLIDNDGNGFVDDVHGWDFVTNDSEPYDPLDFNPGGNPGHGTHVAGTIAAVGNNGVGVTGVMWTAQIMALKACAIDGSCDAAALIGAVEYAVAKGARIINMSLGGTDCSLAEYDAIAAANTANVLVVAAAGNGATNNDLTPNFPSGYSVPVTCQGLPKLALPNVIAVAATDQNDNLASFSNFGSASVQVAAPGVNIFSTIPDVSIVSAFDETFDPNPTPGWTFGGVNNSWATTSAASVSPPNSLTDSPGGNYLNNTDSWARSPNIGTATRRGCRYEGWVRLSTEFGFDGVLFEYSSDGGVTWQATSGFTGSTGGQFINLTLGDLPDAKSTVSIRANLISDSSIVDDGVYLDQVRASCAFSISSANVLQFLGGTSMATPHVTGVAGLLLALNPSFTVSELRTAILTTVDTKPSLTGNVSSGGRLNARAALVSAIPHFTLIVTKLGTGSGMVASNPHALDCGNTCSSQFPLGTSVTLTATAAGGSTFTGWSGGICSGTGTCVVNSDATVTATFASTAPPAPAGGGGDGGGCTLTPTGRGDALLAILFLLSLALLGWRGTCRRR